MKTLEELKAIRDSAKEKISLRKEDDETTRVVVGMATCGIAAGARPVLQALVDDINTRKLPNVIVSQTGCLGECSLEPIVEVFAPGKERVTYVKMTAEKAKRVISEHLVNGSIVTEYTVGAAEQGRG
jgi:NADP-reducing hydrogenase subunit HndB